MLNLWDDRLDLWDWFNQQLEHDRQEILGHMQWLNTQEEKQ